MSATNRGAVRNADDFYETPAWCVTRLMDRVWLPGKEWMEPAAGHGAIIRAVNSCRLPGAIKWTAIDIREDTRPYLGPLCDEFGNRGGMDFLASGWTPDRAVIITNPPFSLAIEFIKHSLPIARYVVMLLRLNFLGSMKRAKFFQCEMSDVYVLPNRPSFTEDGATDATEYAWFVWTPERGRTSGRLEILGTTPAGER